MQYDVIVIGGGASGLMAAISASELGASVLLLERSEKIGRKILASGNGRCNILNLGELRYYGNSKFASEVLSSCSSAELVSVFRHYGLMLSEESEGRVYPFSNQSATVLNTLKTAIQMNMVQVFLQANVAAVSKEGSFFSVILDDNRVFCSGCVIVCCGGLAQAKLGGTSSGYDLLKSFGHGCSELFPSLVPVKTDALSVSGLSGQRVKCCVSLLEGDDLLHREQGEVLFTDYGISGICIMQCSRFIQSRRTYFELNFLQHLFEVPDEFLQELYRRKQLFKHLSPLLLLEGILSSRISYAVLKQAGVPMRGERCDDLSDEELHRIVNKAYHYRINVTGTKGFDYAQVTAGGVLCTEFDSSTLESHLVQGLYACGELLDVDGDCGGFNLMFAFSSGRCAGRNAALTGKTIKEMTV